MFAKCDQCGYETQNVVSLDQLKKLVQKDGGRYKYQDTSCPQCKKRNTLKII